MVMATLFGMDAAGQGHTLAVLTLGIVAIIGISVAYQLVMRMLLREEISRIWRWRCARICIGCGYDIRGLAHETTVCPECGHSLPHNSNPTRTDSGRSKVPSP